MPNTLRNRLMTRGAISLFGSVLMVPIAVVADLSDPPRAYATCLEVNQGNLIRWDPAEGFVEEKNFESATCNDNGLYQFLYRGTSRSPEDDTYVRFWRNGAWQRTPYTDDGVWVYSSMNDENHWSPTDLCITLRFCTDGEFTHRKF